MKKSVLIVENNTKSLSLQESVIQNDKKFITLGGIFTEFDVKNRNERVYTADKFIPCLEELQERMGTLGAVYGEFDHPDVFDTSLQKASHVITNISFVKEANNVQGKIQLLNTQWGKEAQSIVNDNLPVFVSSRAAGITESDGSVTLKKLFTYDIVADPGFGSAKMSCINESMGYKADKNTNFRIYEIEDESKINELFTMNKNDMVTKEQLTDYSKYLVEELGKTKQEVKKAMKAGNLTPKKLEELLGYYEALQTDNSKMVKYLDYLAEKVQIVVEENKQLKGTTEKLISHNDYLAENLEKTINYSEYIAENLDNSIKYQEYIAENLDSSIKYSEYVGENVDNAIKYSEYIAESVDNNIKYSEYLAENLDNSIKYSEYLGENLETNIEYAEYIAEHVDNNIQYSEYLAENLEGNIAYSEYIAEHLDDNIAYSDYIAENLDKTIAHSKDLVGKLNERVIGKLNENYEDGETPEDLPMPPFEELPEEEGIDDDAEMIGAGEEIDNAEADLDGAEVDVEDAEAKLDQIKDIVNDADTDLEDAEAHIDDDEADLDDAEADLDDAGIEDDVEDVEMYGEKLNSQIDKLIEEAKKRKVSETVEHHFLKFLNKSQVDSFYSLTQEERENVALYINEKKGYYSQGDVLKMMKESLEISKTETLDEKLVRLIPESLNPVWEKLEGTTKKSVLSSARLYPNLVTEDAIEHFWLTRKQLKVVENNTRKLVSESPLIQEDVIAESEMNSILERFKSI